MSLGRLPSLGSILLLIAGVVLLLATRGDDPGPAGGEGSPAKRAQAQVVEVVDGDTARVTIAGREESVRYIGIDTPESVIPGERPECFGKAAALLNRELVEDERVTLVFGRERRDRYDRLLAYVYVGERLINAEIVRRGYARTLAIAPNTDFADRFARLQQEAANAGRGLWAAC
jgi:micrococcal nuclease